MIILLSFSQKCDVTVAIKLVNIMQGVEDLFEMYGTTEKGHMEL